MQRFTISLDEKLAREFDRLIAVKGYGNRSEAVRDLLREKLEQERLRDEPAGDCVATLSYVYNHHERDLARRITAQQHDHHDVFVSALHVHLDHDNCLETAVLQGPVMQVRQCAEALVAERGVRHGKLHLVPTSVTATAHRHGHKHAGKHTHRRPKS